MDHQENSSNASRVKPFKSDETPENFVTYAEHEALMLDFQAADKDRRRLARKVMALEKEQDVTEDSPEASTIKTLLELWWKEVMASDKRVAHSLESTRAPKVRAALRRRKKVDGDEDKAFDICRRAILGVTYDDWAMGRVKKSRGKAFNDIAEHILNTDGDIEKFAKLYDEHNPTPEQRDELQERRDRAALERGVKAADDKAAEQARREAAARERRLTFGDGLIPWDRLIGALRSAGSDVVMYDGNPDAFKAQCPAHEDRNPSLGVNRASDGTILVFCRAGCQTADVLSALGLAFSDLYENAERDHAAKDFMFRVKADPAESGFDYEPPNNRGGGPKRRGELADTLRLIEQTLRSWEKAA